MNIFNLSFGKDSMATLLLAIEQGIKIDRVMYCDIRFSEGISGEHPIMAKWIPTAEKILVELGYNECDAYTVCAKYNLLSPVYTDTGAFRSGCWFCPKQRKASLYSLWKNYPAYFNMLQELERFSHTTFKPGKTLAELSKEFSTEGLK